MPPTERRVPATGGVELHVRQWPDGPGVPLLLVHGLASNARLWDGCADALAVLGHPVAAVDLRGHGRSDRPDDGYDHATITADLVAVVDALGWRRPVLAGQSWGGNVVVELAARHPGVAGAVVGIDGGFLRIGRRFATWAACEKALAPPETTGTPLAAMEAGFRRAHPDWPETGIAGALACFEVRPDGTVAPLLTRARHLRIVRTLWEERLDDAWPRVDVPVLLLPCDDGSPWVDEKRADVAAAEAALPDARTRWFTADHDVHAQHPAEVADELHRFAEARAEAA